VRLGCFHRLASTEPLSARAALWPSLYGHTAPALVAWVYETGGAVVVRPAGDPPNGPGWTRLPKGWRADGTVIEINDQLEDITTGLPSRPCWPGDSAEKLVRSILRNDGLSYWHVRVNLQTPDAGPSDTCSTVIQTTGGSRRQAPNIVVLVVHDTPQPPHDSVRYPNRFGGRRRLAEARANRSLHAAGRCASISRAETQWRSEAQADGVPAREYVLSSAVSSGGTSCARILISEPGGGGPASVVAADYP
jgi:hypothetical protein